MKGRPKKNLFNSWDIWNTIEDMDAPNDFSRSDELFNSLFKEQEESNEDKTQRARRDNAKNEFRRSARD